MEVCPKEVFQERSYLEKNLSPYLQKDIDDYTWVENNKVSYLNCL